MLFRSAKRNATRAISLALRFAVSPKASTIAPPMADERLNEGSLEHVESRRRSTGECAGRDGYPYGFNLISEEGKPLVSFAYVTRAAAEAAAAQIQSAIEEAVEVQPHG